MRKIAKVLVEFRHARLVVGGIDDRARGGVKAIAEAALGMIEPSGSDTSALDFPFLAAGNFAEIAGRGHHANVDGKIRAGELGFENLAQTIAAKKFGLEAVKVKAVLGLEEGVEKRNALDVIPVIVGDENVSVECRRSEPCCAPMIAEAAQAGAAIENEVTCRRER